ncbi:hypothetical protein QUA54_15115 [Microcoleus sp. MOSTC5]|uniref:hypothetical protein n=1 Tax=Microcoleus TaxID=44471 RepID=UPI0015530E62|nr:hypothetical protein [Microcoleus asticus]
MAHFTVAGSTPNSIAGSKVGLLPKTCDLRAIGAIDKQPALETKADKTSTTFCLILYLLLKTGI